MKEAASANSQRPTTLSRAGGGLIGGKGAKRRIRSEIAEGVISTAIAVLIVAFLGIGLWKGFDMMMNSATDRTQQQVEQIGN